MSALLEILFEDEWLVAVDKPAGQLVHPAEVPQVGDEVTMKILRDQIGGWVYSVHRLDRPTSGVLLFGKDKKTARKLTKMFTRHEARTIYRAGVAGEAPGEAWHCEEALQKEEGAPWREARTDFRVLQRGVGLAEGLRLLEAEPQSGRYHQIRRHLAGAGLPIVGDFRYGGREWATEWGRRLGTGDRMLLQAKELHFTHPRTGESLAVSAPLTPEMASLFP
ncbi:MAG: RluA family pseudouridine synthase [Verrucomicrobiales bacterium]